LGNLPHCEPPPCLFIHHGLPLFHL
jgi:hypothetical protein